MTLNFDPKKVVQAAIARGQIKRATKVVDEFFTVRGKPRKTRPHPELHGLPRGERQRRYQIMRRKGLL